jgi:hypothetical protein
MSPKGIPFWFSPAFPLSSWNVYATSSGVIGRPSDHFTPSRMVKVTFV